MTVKSSSIGARLHSICPAPALLNGVFSDYPGGGRQASIPFIHQIQFWSASQAENAKNKRLMLKVGGSALIGW
jgi:hypothetical protein